MAVRRTVLEVLQAALSKLVEYGWIKEASGNRSKGYCMTGAIEASTKSYDLRRDAIDRLWDALEGGPKPAELYLRSNRVQEFNDRDDTQEKHIIALYRRAIRLAKQQG